MHRRLILMGCIYAGLIHASHAERFIDGRELLQSYEVWKHTQESAAKSASEGFVAGAYIGYVVSTADMYSSVSKCFVAFAKKNKLNRNQLGEIAGRYLKDNSEDLSESGASLVLQSFINKSKCI